MSEAVLFFTNGTEEIEAITIADILRRAEISLSIISLVSDVAVTGGHNVIVMADALFDDFDFTSTKLFILPGGTPAYGEHKGVEELFKKAANDGKLIAAICLSPMFLGKWGLLDGKRATCYPGYEKHLDSATYVDDLPVVVDGKTITGKGPAFSIDFALALVEALRDKDTRDKVAKGLLLEK